MAAISEESAKELFELIRENTKETANVNTKVATLIIRLEKRCEIHIDTTGDHETRLRGLEDWIAGQKGLQGFVKQWGPVMASVGLALWTIHKTANGG